MASTPHRRWLPPISAWPWGPRVPRHPPKPPTSSCWWINWIACCRQSGLRADHALSRWKASMQVGLSVLGMIAAALGHITPVQGAIFQEVIDIAVILNALRALHDRQV